MTTLTEAAVKETAVHADEDGVEKVDIESVDIVKATFTHPSSTPKAVEIQEAVAGTAIPVEEVQLVDDVDMVMVR